YTTLFRSLSLAIEQDVATEGPNGRRGGESGLSVAELETRMADSGVPIPAATTGYLQFVAYRDLVDIAATSDGVIRLLHRPGHFVVEGLPLAEVWPPDAAPAVARLLEDAHFTGPHRTLAQDLTFAIDQLVEIAIRALSPAVNDTFTALTCIDWLSDGLRKITATWNPNLVHRDDHGHGRVLLDGTEYARYVERSFDKIRQASRGMPAVMIRQLDALEHVIAYATTDAQRAALREEADLILRASDESVPEPRDREVVASRHRRVVEAAA